VSVKVLEDGTRVYSNRTTYTPIPPEQRKKISRKPDAPGAFRFNADWFMPLPLIPEEQRSLPETRPDRRTLRLDRRRLRRQMRSESSAIS
jgi:hypothetical protein